MVLENRSFYKQVTPLGLKVKLYGFEIPIFYKQVAPLGLKVKFYCKSNSNPFFNGKPKPWKRTKGF